MADAYPDDHEDRAADDELPAVPDEAYTAARDAAENHQNCDGDAARPYNRCCIRAAVNAVWPLALDAATDLVINTVKPLARLGGRVDALRAVAQDLLNDAAWHAPIGLADPAEISATDLQVAQALRERAERYRQCADELAGVGHLEDAAERRAGYEQAISTLLDVAHRTGSPAAQWAADYLAADPDRRKEADRG